MNDRFPVEVHVGELPTVVADPSQMEQLLQNLVSNAATFRPEKDPRIWSSPSATAPTG